MKKIQAYLTERQIRYVSALAREKGVKVSDALRRILDEFLDRKEIKR